MAERTTKSRKALSRAILNQTKDLLKVYTVNQYSQALIGGLQSYISFFLSTTYYFFTGIHIQLRTSSLNSDLFFLFYSLVLVLRTLCFS